MERSEPTLVPQWLKNPGASTAGSAISHSDDHPTSRVARNKPFVNNNGHEFGRTSISEKTTSSYFRRSSSSNSSGSFRSYNTLGRHLRDWDLEKDAYDSRDQDNSILGDRRHRNISDPFGDTSLSKFERDGFRRSQSMISSKGVDLWPKKVSSDSGKNTHGLLIKGSPVAGVSKASFERDFPSLGPEERVASPEVGRVPSPGLNAAIQNLPVGTPTSIGGEKWTSALAEVPMLVGSNGVQPTTSNSASVALGSTTSLNMAEAVAQGPSRAQTTPQLSVGTQRLEELAIKQSRQLIPVTPSMPKTLALNSSDKQRSKVSQQQHSSLPLNNSPRAGPVKGDVLKVSNVGKLHVLKPSREKNGVTTIIKDISSPTSGNSISATPSVGSTATKAPLNNPIPERKPVLTILEKRPTSQAKSRNDFFKLMRKKSMTNSVSPDSTVENSQSCDTLTATSKSNSDKHSETEATPHKSEPVKSPLIDPFSEEKNDFTSKSDTCDAHKYPVSNGEKHPTPDPVISEEEEAAFLRSLGWEENDDEGGLTEEEINAFYRDVSKYNSKPSLRTLQRVQLKFLMPLDAQLGGGIGGISPDAKLES